MSYSSVNSTLLQGGWLPFSGQRPPPHPLYHQWRWWKAKNANMDWGIPPGTFSSLHSSRNIFFFARSALWRQFSGVFAEWDLASVFTLRMLWTLSVPFCRSLRISRPPFCCVAYSFFVGDVVLDVSGFSVVLFTDQPAKMRGSLRTWVGVEDSRDRSATPSWSSLWRAVARPPLMQSRAWKMEKATLQLYQSLGRSRGSRPLQSYIEVWHDNEV